MKNKLQKLFAVMISVLMVATSSVIVLPVSADEDNQPYFYGQYDINNAAYIEKINKIGRRMELEEEFIEAYHITSSVSELKHIYFRQKEQEFNPSFECYFEFEGTAEANKGIRIIQMGSLFFEELIHDDGNEKFYEEHTVEELNDFLSKNGYKAHFGEKILERTGSKYTGIIYDEISEENIIKTYLALKKEYGLKLNVYYYCSSPEMYKDETTTTTTFGTMTIAGDIDLNNEQGISDIVTLTKYNTSPDLYPITDPTALANADMNKDGAVNTLDASILIEIALGTYESAF